jgi:hypothetical protein
MDTYEVLNKDGNWEEVTFPDPRLKEVRNALRMLKISAKRIGVEQIPLHEQFAEKAYAPVGVSRKFFQLTRKTFIGLRHNPAHWQLMEYLLFLATPDEKLGLIPLPRNLLAAMENREVNHYKALPFLLRFQRDVMSPDTFAFSEGWDWKAQQCRMVTKFVLPAHYAEALEKEKFDDKKEVFFCGGHKWSQRKAQEVRAKQWRKMEARDWQWISPSAKEVIEYMNNSDPRPFKDILRRNYAAAVTATRRLAPQKRKREMRILQAIKKEPQPRYAPSRSKRTPRIWARGRNNIPQLKSEIRKVLTKGWVEADLKSAQLAINAVLWGAERTRSFLEDEGDVWEMLYEYLDILPVQKETAKKELKKTIYAIWFDRKAHLVGPMLTTALRKKGVQTEGRAIYSVPIIREMLQEREHAKATIVHQGGVKDCNGRWIPLAEREPASLMAEAAQVAEMELLLPMIRMAKTTDDFQVTLYQHDGMSLFFRRKKQAWMERIDEEVKKKAKDMGFPTGLAWEEL